MEQGTTPDSAMWTLRSRGPAHAVSHTCLEVQSAARPRGRFARLFGRDPLHPDAVSSFRGALGELRVGRMLRDLGPDWRVLHAVPCGDAIIDHLLIGPAGVIALTTENHPGRRLRTLEAEAAAQRASRALSRAAGMTSAVLPIVVAVDRTQIRIGEVDPRVAVVPASRLLTHLRALPATSSPLVVRALARAAEEWTTWRPLGADVIAHTDPDPAFERLRGEVVGARVRRTAWSSAVVVGAASGVIGVAAALLG